MSVAVRVGSTVAVLAVAGSAHASNETHERTPVVWDGEAICGTTDADLACGLVIDRSSQTSWHLADGIPLEDTDVTPDEVVDSRRHQFIALCRQPPPVLERPPTWISQADVQAASEVIVCTTPMDEGPEECAPLADPDLVDAEDVLETSAAWAGCWHRITADDMRRPITCEMAEQGVDWDVSTVPVGVYVLEGYTWEPALNLWSQRPGFVKLVDDPNSADQDLPAAALLDLEGDGIVYSGDTVDLEGCVDALDGSTMTAQWAILPNGPGEPAWTAFAVDQPVEDGSLVLSFEVPEAAEAEFISIRVIVEDPMGRSWTAYLPRELGVLPGTECPEEGGGIVSDPNCPGGEDTGGSTGEGGSDGSGSTSGGEGSSSGAAAEDGTGGCGCSSTRAAAPALWMLGLLALVPRRRRVWRS